VSSIAFLGMGSNVDARHNIASGLRALQESFGALELSPFYECPSYGFEGADFINLVVRMETAMGPLQLKQHLHGIEDRHARRRDAPRFSDRTLDIDILLFDDLWLLSPALEIPRDEILSAAHVLKPLADIAPGLRHPVCGRTMAELWAGFESGDAELRPIEL
jgi:2-amino-4-hydroxy-6-hydroxymethyldihydropteridine diphosphokinase